jgi:hypothetical protein
METVLLLTFANAKLDTLDFNVKLQFASTTQIVLEMEFVHLLTIALATLDIMEMFVNSLDALERIFQIQVCVEEMETVLPKPIVLAMLVMKGHNVSHSYAKDWNLQILLFVEKLDSALLPINVNVQLDIMVILEIVHQFVLESMQEMQLFVAVLELVLALISAIAQAMFMV